MGPRFVMSIPQHARRTCPPRSQPNQLPPPSVYSGWRGLFVRALDQKVTGKYCRAMKRRLTTYTMSVEYISNNTMGWYQMSDAVRVNLLMPRHELDDIDRLAGLAGMDRSAIIRRSCRVMIAAIRTTSEGAPPEDVGKMLAAPL